MKRQRNVLYAESLEDKPMPNPGKPFYVCTRCGSMYQSIYGCGCILADRALTQKGQEDGK